MNVSTTVASSGSFLFAATVGLISLGDSFLGGLIGQQSPQPSSVLVVDPLPGPSTASPLGELWELRTSVCPPCPVCEAAPEPRAFAARLALELIFWLGVLLALVLLVAFRCYYDLVRDVRSLHRIAERRAIVGAPIRFG